MCKDILTLSGRSTCKHLSVQQAGGLFNAGVVEVLEDNDGGSDVATASSSSHWVPVCLLSGLA